MTSCFKLGGSIAIAISAVASPPAVAEAEEEAIIRAFVNAQPYQAQPLEPLQEALQNILDGNPDSVFLPGSRLAPPTRALLKVQAAEGVIAPARYRIRYGQIQIPNPPKASPLTVSLIQVDRFNLGPARRVELEREHGTEHVRADSYSEHAHVSWRFAMQPVMGTTAMTEAATRTVIPQAFAEAMDCLGSRCSATTATRPPGQLTWQPGEAPATNFHADYVIEKNGIPSAAAVLDLLLVEAQVAARNDRITWLGFEPREGVPPGDLFVEIVIETGLAPEADIAGLLRDDNLMDHLTRTAWIHLRAVATAPEQPPIVDLKRAHVPWSTGEFD